MFDRNNLYLTKVKQYDMDTYKYKGKYILSKIHRKET